MSHRGNGRPCSAQIRVASWSALTEPADSKASRQAASSRSLGASDRSSAGSTAVCGFGGFGGFMRSPCRSALEEPRGRPSG